ncbi:Hypothetical predicted protein [Olea europaea subsp. europaea]|uniref:Uncharacterized protein n=1 Tax=Olea europaea subsp. europaea TaxID=158383 RepID=A0A8S0RZ42_OLEEU|nr:Hypothetical predicted protein [Olea europaea subsp. europaea]
MEQSTSNTSRNPLSAFFMEDEIEVSQILLDLHKLIDVSEPRKRTKTEYKFEIITVQEGYKFPDLNIPSEDTFREDDINKVVADRRAKCAEARRIRRGLINAKLMKKFAIRHA